MARLPIPGKDAGRWGDVLNEYLRVEHTPEGTLKLRNDGTLNLKANDADVVHLARDELITGDKSFSQPVTLPNPTQAMHATTKAYVDQLKEDIDTELTDQLTITYRNPQRQTSVLSLFQSGHGWTTSGQIATANLNDTSTFIKGVQSASITTTGNGGGGGNLELLAGLNLDLTRKAIKITCKIDDVSKLSQLNFLVGTNNSFSNNFKWQLNIKNASSTLIQSEEWIELIFGWADVHSAGGTLTLDAGRNPSVTSGFTKARFQIIDKGAGGCTFHVQAVEIVDNMLVDYPNGLVSIVFDDNLQSTYTLAKSVMDAYGFRGSAYVIADSVDTPGRLTLEQLQNMQDYAGWEIAGHAFSQAAHDARFTTLASTEVDTELRKLKIWLRDNKLYGTSFAYPGGFFEKTTDGIMVQQLVEQYFTSGRTVVTGYGASTNIIAEQAPSPRPYRLIAQSGISEASAGIDLPSSFTGIGGELDTCKNQGAWLILVFHNVTTSTPTSNFDISLSAFSSILAGIAVRGIKVLPVEEVMRRYVLYR